MRTRRSISVTIPAGVDEGNRIQLTGEGEVGPGGGPAGDLYLEINVNRHPVFQRKGDQLFCQITVPMTAAALGTHLDLPTLEADLLETDDEDRTVGLDVAAGTQSGDTLTIKGYGVPRLAVAGSRRPQGAGRGRDARRTSTSSRRCCSSSSRSSATKNAPRR